MTMIPSLVFTNALREVLASGGEPRVEGVIPGGGEGGERLPPSLLALSQGGASLRTDAAAALWRRVEFFASRTSTTAAKQASPLLDETTAEPLQSCGNLQISGGSLDFGDVRVNNLATRSFTIRNPNCCPVNFTLSGGGYGFSISTSGGTIPANGSISVTVTFTPYNAQYYSGTASITPGGAGITMSGRGVANN